MPTFSQRLYDLALTIPPGRVTTYGTLAKAAGGTGQAARSVGNILSRSPNPKAIPWHRIVYASGKVWLTDEHDATRRKLYRQEGIDLNQNGQITNFDDIFFDFTEVT